MDGKDVLIEGFGRVKETLHGVVGDLDISQLTGQVSDEVNSIAWLAWHIARCIDAQIAPLMETEEIWTNHGWYEKFDLPFDKAEMGYGMSSEDAGKVKASAELLLGYYDDVHTSLIEYLRTLKKQDFAEVIDRSYTPPVTLGVRLISILDDCLQHTGQAAYLKGMLN